MQNYVLLGDLHMKQGRGKDAVESYLKAIDAHVKAVREADAEFLRRLYLDVTGIPPAADTVRKFQANTSAHRREKALDMLLEATGAKAANPAASGTTNDPSEMRNHLAGIELYTKLAQAYLSMGDHEYAQRTLKSLAGQARDLEEWVQAGRPTAGTTAKPAAGAAKATLPTKLIISAPKKLLDQVGTGKISLDEFKKTATVQYLTFGPAEKNTPPAGTTGGKPVGY